MKRQREEDSYGYNRGMQKISRDQALTLAEEQASKMKVTDVKFVKMIDDSFVFDYTEPGWDTIHPDDVLYVGMPEYICVNSQTGAIKLERLDIDL